MTTGYQLEEAQNGDPLSASYEHARSEAPVRTFDRDSTDNGTLPPQTRPHWTLEDMRWLGEAIIRNHL
jgi:hypothetical protein